VRATILGPFPVSRGELRAGPWPRPSAKRLVQWVLVIPSQRVGREAACDALFPHLRAPAAAVALSKALSMASAALSLLGDAAAGLVRADGSAVWVGLDVAIDPKSAKSGKPHRDTPRRAIDANDISSRKNRWDQLLEPTSAVPLDFSEYYWAKFKEGEQLGIIPPAASRLANAIAKHKLT